MRIHTSTLPGRRARAREVGRGTGGQRLWRGKEGGRGGRGTGSITLRIEGTTIPVEDVTIRAKGGQGVTIETHNPGKGTPQAPCTGTTSQTNSLEVGTRMIETTRQVGGPVHTLRGKGLLLEVRAKTPPGGLRWVQLSPCFVPIPTPTLTHTSTTPLTLTLTPTLLTLTITKPPLPPPTATAKSASAQGMP